MTAARMRHAASPLSLHRHLPERSSPSRVRSAAQNRRALDRSGPFRKPLLDKGKGANAKAKPFPIATDCCLPLVGPQQFLPRNPKIRSPPLDDVNNLQA
jgi:hypothetical protein